jgi:Tol biopolymer transport system component
VRTQLVLALSLAAGCGFTAGTGASPGEDAPPIDASGDVADDTMTDGMVDAAPTSTCLDHWFANTIRFVSPVQIANVNSTSFERDPFLTPDELTLYFSSARTGSTGSDTWVATRTAITAAFGTPVRSTTFSTSGNDTKASITADGLYAVVGSDQAGGSGGVDIWETSRGTTGASWGALGRAHVMAVDTAASDHDPMISASGLHLYDAPDAPGMQHIALATRLNRTASFGAAATIAELESGTGDGDPTITADERIIVFYSNRTSAFTGGNLWYATRASATAAFAAPRIVPDVNTNNNDGDPHLSGDGCRLYFGRDGGVADWELFVAIAQ